LRAAVETVFTTLAVGVEATSAIGAATDAQQGAAGSTIVEVTSVSQQALR
jgi:hypothetical protein